MGKRKRSKAPLTTSDLEARMRPGAWYGVGFLGPRESLEAVIAQDAKALAELGTSHDRVAEALESILISARVQAQRTPWYQRMGEGVLYNILANHKATTKLSRDDFPRPEEGFLMREHHFFEGGVGSPYRVDPARVVSVIMNDP